MALSVEQRYDAFGLTLSSAVDLPELDPATGTTPGSADVTITVADIVVPSESDPDRTVYAAAADDVYLRYDYATVRIVDGTRIIIDPRPDAPAEVVRHILLGPALHHLLDQRGYFVLHASTVAIGDRAVAFVGPSGQGKTTTAMACLAAGHQVLSDDVAAIRLVDDQVVVRSGYPAIKLDPAALEEFDAPIFPPVETCSNRSRHFYRLTDPQPSEPIPLERVYYLEDGPDIDIAPQPPHERVMTLVDNTYNIGTLGTDDVAVTNFEACSAVADRVAVKRLRRPRRLDALPSVVEVVCADLLDGDR